MRVLGFTKATNMQFQRALSQRLVSAARARCLIPAALQAKSGPRKTSPSFIQSLTQNLSRKEIYENVAEVSLNGNKCTGPGCWRGDYARGFPHYFGELSSLTISACPLRRA